MERPDLHVLLCCIPCLGHIKPVTTLAMLLAEAGHKVSRKDGCFPRQEVIIIVGMSQVLHRTKSESPLRSYSLKTSVMYCSVAAIVRLLGRQGVLQVSVESHTFRLLSCSVTIFQGLLRPQWVLLSESHSFHGSISLPCVRFRSRNYFMMHRGHLVILPWRGGYFVLRDLHG